MKQSLDEEEKPKEKIETSFMEIENENKKII